MFRSFSDFAHVLLSVQTLKMSASVWRLILPNLVRLRSVFQPLGTYSCSFVQHLGEMTTVPSLFVVMHAYSHWFITSDGKRNRSMWLWTVWLRIIHVFLVIQASGVAISDEVVLHYNSIKVRRQDDQERERHKLVMMRVSKDQKSIIVDHDNSLKNKDVEKAPDIFQAVISKLPPKECCYGLYDCHYVTKESVKEDLIFIMWYEAPLGQNC